MHAEFFVSGPHRRLISPWILPNFLQFAKLQLGESHPGFAQSLNNLAGLYHTIGRHKEAKPLYKQALEIYREVLGEHHPLFALFLNNLQKDIQQP